MDQNDLEAKTFTRQQKIGFVLLLFFGVLTIALGLLQLHNTIYGSFAIRLSNASELQNSTIADPVERLKSIDTDQDGLTDYDELSIYGTSPYLWSTASDSVSDKEKIERGLNPLCPADNQTCSAGELEVGAATTSEFIATSPIGDIATPEDIVAQSVVQDQDNAYVDLKQQLKDPIQLRQMILSTGQVSAEVLSKIDDASLIKMVDEIMNNQLGEPGRPVSTTNY